LGKDVPILYSFRRCPYAIRARWALLSSNIEVELREVVLKDKPHEFLKASNSGTVPCLQLKDQIIDESIDIMIWALRKNDPKGWLDMPDEGYRLIEEVEKKFKPNLDKAKYATRYPQNDSKVSKNLAIEYLIYLDKKIKGEFFFGEQPKLADIAIFPFVRQFANIDTNWFNEFGWQKLQNWLKAFVGSNMFDNSQKKFDKWRPAADPVYFP
jgi:glutathione S-transferase